MSRYSNKIESVGLRKCPYYRYLIEKVTSTDVKITNISQSLPHKMAENSRYEEITSLSPYVYSMGMSRMVPWTHATQHPKRHRDRYGRFCTAHGRESIYFTVGRPPPLKIAPSRGGSELPSNTWFLGPTRVHILNDMSMASAVFAGLMIVTDRPTDRQRDRPRYSVCNSRPHLRSTAVRPKIK